MRHTHVLGLWLLAAGMLSGGLLAAADGHAAPAGCVAHTLPNAGGHQNGGLYYLCSVDTSRFADALCNDGTNGVFQWQPASSAASTDWVIWLAGGYQCQDAATCAARATNPKTQPLTTSRHAAPRIGQGVLSHDQTLDPALAGANTVLVRYCSSDAWVGGYRAPNGPGGFVATDPATWNFEGRAIAKGAVGTLGALGVGFLNATRIVLGGSSAGAFGITVVANDLLPLLPGGAQVLLASDAGFTLDTGRYDSSLPAPYVQPGPDTPLYRLLNDGHALWGGRGDALCDAKAVAHRQQIACYDTSRLLQDGFVTLPSFLAQSLLDTPELQSQLCPVKNGQCAVPHDPASRTGVYATEYARRMAALISEQQAPTVPYAAFSPDAYVHTMLDNDTTFTTPFAFSPAPRSARDAFDAWLADPGAPGHAALGTGPGVQ